jgi:hypothetical protein
MIGFFGWLLQFLGSCYDLRNDGIIIQSQLSVGKEHYDDYLLFEEREKRRGTLRF